MQNQKIRKVLAGMLTTTMVLGMATTTFAQTGSATGTGTGTGTGSFEGHVDKEVVEVTLPTADAKTFSYKMDPEGLIAATNSAKYSDASFEAGKNVYFQSSDGNWTSNSTKLKVVNKGTVDIDVTVSAKTAANTDVAMADSETFGEDDTDAKLYLGLLVAEKDAVAIKEAAADSADDASVAVGLRGNADNYEVTSTDSGYAFAAKAGVPDTAWNSFEFGLTGACNPKGDYSAEDLAGSDVTVTWSYAVREDSSTNDLLDANATSESAPSIATTSYNLTADTPVEINVNLGGGALAATKVSALKNGTSSLPTDSWSYAEGVLTITAARVNTLVNAGVSRTYTVVFNDTAKTTVDIILNGTGN